MSVRRAVRSVGLVKEVLPGELFRVELQSGESVLAHVGSQLRTSVVRVLPGHRVSVELSPYDLSRGRIVRKVAVES